MAQNKKDLKARIDSVENLQELIAKDKVSGIDKEILEAGDKFARLVSEHNQNLSADSAKTHGRWGLVFLLQKFNNSNLPDESIPGVQCVNGNVPTVTAQLVDGVQHNPPLMKSIKLIGTAMAAE